MSAVKNPVEHVVDETGYSMKRRPVSGPKTANEEFLKLGFEHLYFVAGFWSSTLISSVLLFEPERV